MQQKSGNMKAVLYVFISSQDDLYQVIADQIES